MSVKDSFVNELGLLGLVFCGADPATQAGRRTTRESRDIGPS